MLIWTCDDGARVTQLAGGSPFWELGFWGTPRVRVLIERDLYAATSSNEDICPRRGPTQVRYF